MDRGKCVWSIKKKRNKMLFCRIFRKGVYEFENFYEENNLKSTFYYTIILNKMIEIGKIYVKNNEKQRMMV